LLLESVEHVDDAREPDGVDRPVRVPVVVLDDLQDPGAIEPLQGLCIRVLSAGLRVEQRLTDRLPDTLRELPNVFRREAGLGLPDNRAFPPDQSENEESRKNGEWRMENGEWRMENGEWRTIGHWTWCLARSRPRRCR